MTKQEISTFIEKMAELGDTDWTPENVSEAYGDSSLSQALADQKATIEYFGDIIASVLNH